MHECLVFARGSVFVCVGVREALSSPGDVYRLRSVAKFSLVRVPLAERASGSTVFDKFVALFSVVCDAIASQQSVFSAELPLVAHQISIGPGFFR